MPRTIVVIDGAGVQGAAVIEMLLNANVSVQGTSQSSSGGARPKHLSAPESLHNDLSSFHGDAFKKLEEFDAAQILPVGSGSPEVERKLLDNFGADAAPPSPALISSSADTSLAAAEISASSSFQTAEGHDVPEEALIAAAADAATVTVGPNVLSHIPGYLASAECLRVLPPSLPVLTPSAEIGTPEMMPRLELPPVSAMSETSSASTDVSSSSDYGSAVETLSGTLRASSPPFTPPKPIRRNADTSISSLRSFQQLDAAKSSTNSIHSAISTSKPGSSGEEIGSPVVMPVASEFGLHDPTRSKAPGSTGVWKLRSVMEGELVGNTTQSSGGGKWAGMVESRIVDYSDASSLQHAMSGIYGLFIGLDAFSSSPKLFQEKYIRNIVQEAVRANVQHVIYAGHVTEDDAENPQGTKEADLGTLPITVQRCMVIYKILKSLATSGLFRLTVLRLPVCFEAALLCEHSWFSLRPKSNTYVLDIPVPSSTVMPFCSLADVGNAALQVFSRPERFDGIMLDLTSDIASPRELAVQMTQVTYVSGKKVVHCDEQHHWLSEQLQTASLGGEELGKQSLMGLKTVNMILLREFLLFMSASTRKPLTLLLPQVRTNARRYNLRLTPWREFAVNFCDDLLVAWR